MTTRKKKVTRGAAAAARSGVGDVWDKLEKIFEQRVTKVLNSLRIPTHADIAELNGRVEELTRKVQALSKGEAGGKAPAKAAAAGRTRARAGAKKKAAGKAGGKKTES